MKRGLFAGLLLPSVALLAADPAAPVPPPPAAASIKDPSSTMKTVSYHDSDIVPIAAQVHYATLVEIQDDDVIAIALGDTDSWDENHHANTVFVKPKKTGIKTDLIVIGQKRAYTFTLTEISDTPGLVADLKVFVKPTDTLGVPKFASIAELEAERQRTKAAQQALEALERREQAERGAMVESARSSIESGIRHVYKWSGNQSAHESFTVSSIYDLDGWTVIEGKFQEAPAIYEVKDGKDSLVESEMKDGKYVIKKVVRKGYLRFGKAKLTFEREG